MITELLYYIFIFPLEQVLEVVLHNILKVIPSYGVSIILLSLVVNLFLLKIFLYTDKKAQQEADLKEKLDKRIKSWKSVYKRAKLYAFTQTLYRQHNYHPIYALRSLGGLALQIPFFFAMYEIINKASYLQSVRFLWIDDLSKPDSIMLFGFSIHILPLLMTAFTLINVFYSSKELGARVQGSLIALLFLVLLYSMPSALVLYWTCNMAFALFKEIFKRKKHSSLSNHSQDCASLEAVITAKVTPAPKSTQNLQSNTALVRSTSPYLQNTRMYESVDRVGIECQTKPKTSTLNNTRIADSTPCKHNEKSAILECRDSITSHLSQNTRIADSQIESKNTQFKQNSKDTQSKKPQGKFKTLFFNIFTPHTAIDSKTYTTYRNISILAILNICFMICVFSPYALYSSDVSQFDINQTYQTLAVLFGAFLCSSFMVIYITSFFYKTRLFKFGVYVASILFLIGAINTFIFVGDYGTMDHFVLQKPEFNNPNNILYALCAFIASIVIVYFCFKWLKTIFSVSFITLFVLSVISFFNIMEANKTYIVPKSLVAEDNLQPYEKELFSYSKTEKNIVVMVLDMFSGSHIHPLLEQFPEFKTQLDGFVLFDNAISTTNSTIHSIATLIGGEHYAVYNMNARKDILVDSITEAFGVIGDTFVKNGYDVGYFMGDWAKEKKYLQSYNKNMVVVQQLNLYANYFMQNNQTALKAFEAAEKGSIANIKKILSFGVFRLSPEVLRSGIYNNSEWLRYKDVDNNAITAVSYASSFYAFTHLHNTESKRPTFKYLHALMTHVPYSMYYEQEKCIFVNRQDKLGNKTAWHDYPHKVEIPYRNKAEARLYFKHYDSEACALHYLSTFIQWLKDNGIYGNTQIFVVSDHSGFDSIGIPSSIAAKEGRPDVLFLFKDFNANGELKIDSRLMANYDISSIFCENLPNGCPNVPKNILQHYPQNRNMVVTTPVSWMTQEHKKNEWTIDHYFQVKGNIYDESNWQDITEEVKNGTLKIDKIH